MSKSMKRRLKCRCARAGEESPSLYSGNTVAPRGNVIFDFRLNRGRDGPRLLAIDAQARQQEVMLEARHGFRQEKADRCWI